MSYDKKLSIKLTAMIERRHDFYEQKMFGGIGYLLRGNMCFGLYKEFLILRLGEIQSVKALRRNHVRPFDITGRIMKGWVMISPEGITTEMALKRWISKAIDFVSTLPAK